MNIHQSSRRFSLVKIAFETKRNSDIELELNSIIKCMLNLIRLLLVSVHTAILFVVNVVDREETVEPFSEDPRCSFIANKAFL